MNKARLKKIAAWILFIFIGAMVFIVGVGKFTQPSWPQRFAEWGYPANFYMVIGAVETLAGIGMLIPRIRAYAAASLLVVMLGALGTHIIHAEMPNIIVTSVWSVILGSITYAHRSAFSRARRDVLTQSGKTGA